MTAEWFHQMKCKSYFAKYRKYKFSKSVKKFISSIHEKAQIKHQGLLLDLMQL